MKDEDEGSKTSTLYLNKNNEIMFVVVKSRLFSKLKLSLLNAAKTYKNLFYIFNCGGTVPQCFPFWPFPVRHCTLALLRLRIYLPIATLAGIFTLTTILFSSWCLLRTIIPHEASSMSSSMPIDATLILFDGNCLHSNGKRLINKQLFDKLNCCDMRN